MMRTRSIDGVNGLRMKVLEAGHENADAPCVLLLHGFPELGYSWRGVIPALADAGYHAVAPDQRGYGGTTGWDSSYDGALDSFRMLNLVEDALALVAALGKRSVAAVVGHDFGAPVAAYCALTRPDVFRSVALMSAPFRGAPREPFDWETLQGDLATLAAPRKHYQVYYSTREANADMWKCPQGLHAFLRAYYHYKSADSKGTRPHRLASASAAELAKLPFYYVMERNKGMAETVAARMPRAEEIAGCRWMPDRDLAVYAAEFQRTGFQGALQWYRCATSRRHAEELRALADRTIDVPSCFIAGASDWGVHQRPHDFERMQKSVCTRMLGCHLVEGAGHWVQQEQPGEVSRLLLGFLRAAARP
jgi:pimeloyl-ACP methyl ester carboxylesterase